MNIIKKHKIISIFVAVFLCLVILYLVRYFIARNTIYTESYLRNEEYIMNPKTYDVNEYSVTNITDEQMASIYLLDFRYNVYNDINMAYQSLDESYRNKKFGSLNAFQEYIKSINLSSTISKYYISQGDGNKIYGVYDSNDNLFIFKTNGVMQYTVYLDDYTVEI